MPGGVRRVALLDVEAQQVGGGGRRASPGEFVEVAARAQREPARGRRRGVVRRCGDDGAAEILGGRDVVDGGDVIVVAFHGEPAVGELLVRGGGDLDEARGASWRAVDIEGGGSGVGVVVPEEVDGEFAGLGDEFVRGAGLPGRREEEWRKDDDYGTYLANERLNVRTIDGSSCALRGLVAAVTAEPREF